MSEFTVLGLSGRAGVGKDYLFNSVLKPLGYHRVALADHFKIWIAGKEEATYDEVFNTKPPKIRHLLQQEGTERGRNVYGGNVWCKTLHNWMRLWNENWGISKFCITDIRFPNEVEFVQSVGGSVIRIEAPQRQDAKGLSAEARSHLSETALDFFSGRFDLVINNDPGESGDTVLKAFLIASAWGASTEACL
jgi:hypothetical protein